MVMTWDQVTKAVAASSFLSLPLRSPTMGEVSYMLWGQSQDSLMERSWTEELKPPIRSQQRIASSPVSVPSKKQISSPSQAFRWVQPWLTSWQLPHERSLVRTIQLSHSWIPDSQKLCEIIKVYCCFRQLHFGIIWYEAIDNKYRVTGGNNSPWMVQKGLY